MEEGATRSAKCGSADYGPDDHLELTPNSITDNLSNASRPQLLLARVDFCSYLAVSVLLSGHVIISANIPPLS